ncbi:unnamed protein product [Rotaria sordida]|uniref:Uncharacterized protein n=1 Tax=Rotaria sordida TaxID=392033 RepID=A0A813RIY9_9BILA|nr:unnamed protein product [Rotaria sordida]CAF0826332.1 unnamed protein product [Rotaria sordida]CAF4155785.1 unnamed protein product [Rotaria sordida]CAF4211598.1 unnamed protein product [Rotaria sordida]
MLNNTDILESTLVKSIFNNPNNKYCVERFSIARCYLRAFVYMLAYLCSAFSLLPQIIHLFNYRTRYIAGISYIWIIIRVLALIFLIIGHVFKWASILELMAFISTIAVFIQIILFSKNLHRQNKINLIVISVSIWIIGLIIVFFFRKQKDLLINIGYILLAMQMLSQVLLNSLLRTTKALSKFSITLLAMSDGFLFSITLANHSQLLKLIAVYYSFSLFLFIFLQTVIHNDEHIHLISRSTHAVLTPGVDIFTGLDINGVRSIEQDPQMFSIEDFELTNGMDIVYIPVTTNKSSIQTDEQTSMKKCVWHAKLGCIFVIEIIVTIILFGYIWSLWIIFVPISILVILGIFFLLRTRLSDLQTNHLKNIL